MEEGPDIGSIITKLFQTYGLAGLVMGLLLGAVIYLFRLLREDGNTSLKQATEAVLANTTALQTFNTGGEARLEFNRELLASNRELSGSMKSLELVTKTQHDANTQTGREAIELLRKLSRDIEELRYEVRRKSPRAQAD